MGSSNSKGCSHNYACGHTKAKATASNSRSKTRKANESSGIYNRQNHNGNKEEEPSITQARLIAEIEIKDGSTGKGYQSLFGKYLDESVTSVRIKDPYIFKRHQLQLLLRFCELLIKSCPKIETIHLETKREPESDKELGQGQEMSLAQLKDQLRKRGISLNVTYSTTLHDRKISLSNGYIIKMGRGLDYFNAPENSFSPGWFDLDLRKCRETTFDILRL